MLSVSEFENELAKYARPYDHRIGNWWLARSSDVSHTRAYSNVLRHLSSVLRKTNGLVVDYACGPGIMVEKILRSNDQVRVIGIDGSAEMLTQARHRLNHMDAALSGRVMIINADLPDFSLGVKASVILFSFPNIVPTRNSVSYDSMISARDIEFAEIISSAMSPDNESGSACSEPEEVQEDLVKNRAISRNLRGLLRDGGYCLRIEYALAGPNEQMTLSRQRSEFEAGYLEASVCGRPIDRFFRHVYTRYFKSKVILDVYDQTGVEDDKIGGYWITLLRAR